ncbi:hypothetical protein Xtri_15485 [Xanthomonas campestris pv. trichodesmae]|uniref:Mor transcription activator domain-containing protein n=1 Tax=Xanthomonas citri pv. sesbaniae TaxID=473425 RepID=A0AAW4RQF4_XANCI|nr:hypothetical protein [Xanthomonas campestris pv. trichodesmae]MBZ3925098.1 hypothetical protein [Xanthomonas citri pv. sesbaniae]
MSKRKQAESELRERILDAMRKDIGISETMAQPFVESIMRCFAGEQPYFPARRRDYPLSQIQAELERGVSVKQVLSHFDLSRSKLHELFPGGLPGRGARASAEHGRLVETKRRVGTSNGS